MKIKTTIQFTEWGRRNSKTGNRKIKRMWGEIYESNGLVQPTFEMDSDGNLEITLWCKQQFCNEHEGYHFVFIKVNKNVQTDIVQTLVDAE